MMTVHLEIWSNQVRSLGRSKTQITGNIFCEKFKHVRPVKLICRSSAYLKFSHQVFRNEFEMKMETIYDLKTPPTGCAQQKWSNKWASLHSRNRNAQKVKKWFTILPTMLLWISRDTFYLTWYALTNEIKKSYYPRLKTVLSFLPYQTLSVRIL